MNTVTSGLSSRKTTTNNDSKTTCVVSPTQSPTTNFPATSDRSPTGRCPRKHVQFPDVMNQTNPTGTNKLFLYIFRFPKFLFVKYCQRKRAKVSVLILSCFDFASIISSFQSNLMRISKARNWPANLKAFWCSCLVPRSNEFHVQKELPGHRLAEWEK